MRKKPTPISTRNKKILRVGPNTCHGLRNVLMSFKCSRDMKRVAQDLFAYFAFDDEAKKEQISFKKLTLADKKAAGLPLDQERFSWNNNVGEDLWEIMLSNFEVTVLKEALNQYTDWSIADTWEESVCAQLGIESKKTDEVSEPEKLAAENQP